MLLFSIVLKIEISRLNLAMPVKLSELFRDSNKDLGVNGSIRPKPSFCMRSRRHRSILT
jgi:hypothetical protein